MLNPTWLYTFKTLIDIGHFTQTAEKLFMTQPGVSQHIKKLELACQAELIKRKNKTLELTEQGQKVYEYAVSLIDKEQSLLNELRHDSPYQGCCKIACSGALALRLYDPLLQLQQQHPQLTFQIEVAPNQLILDKIQKNLIDVGLVTQISVSQHFHIEAIGQEQLCLVLPVNYANKPITSQLLQQCGMIDHPDARHYIHLYFEQRYPALWQSVDIKDLPISSYINQLSQILLPVSKGLGFTVLPKSAIDNFTHQQKLHIVPVEKPIYEQLFLVTKRHHKIGARYQTIQKYISEILQK